MTPEEFQQVQAIFLQAAELDDTDRTTFLDTACKGSNTVRAEIEKMLAADVGASQASRLGAVAVAERGAAEDVTPSLPDHIGPYEIVRQIGHGGMGVVYEAVQPKPHRSVALKVLMPGVVSAHGAARFELEGELLGRLQHPSIAQVYESGVATTEAGRQLYLAMELVDGVPLADYVRQRQPDLTERLELFREICRAVAHAHQRGIIHRDLKPANILVTSDGAIKVVDFGVARTTDADLRAKTLQTRTGQLVGTIHYMSPEQCSGRVDAVDTRSDIYALGVILYELLAGRLPYKLDANNILQALQTIQESPPDPLRKHDARFRGDLTTIVNRALAKDPEQRYASANALADDVRSYLRNEPITARAPSAAYIVRKFALRHRVPFALACCLLVMLAAVAAGGTLLSINLARQRDLAKKSQTQEAEARVAAESAMTFLDGLFNESDPENWHEREMSVRDLVQRGVERLQAELVVQPLPRARLQLTLGKVLTTLGDFGKAKSLLTKSRDTYDELHGSSHPDVAEACMALAHLYDEWKKPDSGYPEIQRALTIFKQRLGPGDPKVIAALKQMTANRHDARDIGQALAYAREAWKHASSTYGVDHDETLACANNVAGALFGAGTEEHFAEAEELLVGVLAEPIRDSQVTAKSFDWLMRISFHRGDITAARDYGRQGLEIIQRTLHPTHPEVLFYQREVAFLLDPQEAIPILRDVLAKRRQLHKPGHPRIEEALATLGERLKRVGEYGEADHMLTESLAIRRKLHGDADGRTAWAEHNLACVRFYLQRHEEAEDLWLEAHEILKSRVPEPRLRVITQSLVTLYELLDRPDDVNRWKHNGTELTLEQLRERAEKRAARFGAESLEYAAILAANGAAHLNKDRNHDAEECYREALQIRQRRLGRENDFVAMTMNALGDAILKQDQYNEAEVFFREANDIWSRNHPNVKHLAMAKSKRELQERRATAADINQAATSNRFGD